MGWASLLLLGTPRGPAEAAHLLAVPQAVKEVLGGPAAAVDELLAPPRVGVVEPPPDVGLAHVPTFTDRRQRADGADLVLAENLGREHGVVVSLGQVVQLLGG